ncbi:MAG: flagellar biosynthesis protein FlhA [Synergistales bacterium]|nr:flagellar biosynthesis protein FlhA [Synergistales bacterium]
MARANQEGVKPGSMIQYADIGMALLIVLIVGMLIVPVPTALLDILLSLNITFGVVVLLTTFYVYRVLQMAAFPTILLLATLFRLALNVSTTRMILLHAYAGEVISAFGNFVVGGNYVVGGVVFLILVIIQFIVITKGAERVAEVAARFTLDAMPGKQMAIDADLNAGLLDETQAKERREEIRKEADFYGAMDGASKFVKGDAIAGLIITAINILGGLGVGVFQQDMSLVEALGTYSLLTVGDGLVAQIPSILFSTATGIIVTRAAGEYNLGEDIINSLTRYYRPLWIGSAMLLGLAIVPGLPLVPFATLGSLMGFLGYRVYREGKLQEQAAGEPGGPAGRTSEEGGAPGGEGREPQAPPEPENVLPLLTVDPLEVEIGYALIPLVDPGQGGDMLERISTIRRQMAMELGLVVPPIRLRDNIQLKPTEYTIMVKGGEVGRSELLPDHYLAMNTSGSEETLVGVPTTEPTFGLPAVWISPELREQAESSGYTVVDAPSVLATHISETVKLYGADILTRQEVQKLVDLIKESHPAVVEELTSALGLGDIQKVLQNLIREQVPIRDLVTIFESLADYGRASRSVDFLTERVRESLARVITLGLQESDGTLTVGTLSPDWEKRVQEAMSGDLVQGWQLNMDPQAMQQLVGAVSKFAEQVSMSGKNPVLLVHPEVRLVVRRIIEGTLPHVSVISYNEIAQGVQLKSVGMVE